MLNLSTGGTVNLDWVDGGLLKDYYAEGSGSGDWVLTAGVDEHLVIGKIA